MKRPISDKKVLQVHERLLRSKGLKPMEKPMLENTPGKSPRRFFCECVIVALDLNLDIRPKAVWNHMMVVAGKPEKSNYWQSEKFAEDIDLLPELINSALVEGEYFGTRGSDHKVWGFWQEELQPV